MTVAFFWLLGLPVSAVSAFHLGFGVKGLQFGVLGAAALQCLSFLVILVRTNWQDIANQATERIEKDDIDIDYARTLKVSDSFVAQH